MYRTVRLIARIALQLFFRRIDVAGLEQIPPEGPLIIAANHPNTMVDPLVLMAVVPREVHFLAASILFRYPFFAFFLRGSGVLPIYRHQDDPRQMAKNRETFRACTAILSKGGAIGIFPEGFSHADPMVKRLKTGVAHIALETEAQHQGKPGIVIVPAGLNFEHRSTFRSRVFVNFGRPIGAWTYGETFQHDPRSAINQLTADVQRSLEKLVVHIPEAAMVKLVQDLEGLYKGELLQAYGDQGFSALELSQKLVEGVRYYSQAHPMIVAQMSKAIARYQRKLHRLGVKDVRLKERISRQDLPLNLLKFLGLGLLGFLPALYGTLNNYLPYKLTGIMRWLFTGRTEARASVTLAAGALFFPLFYAIQTFLIGTSLGTWPAVLYLLSLPVTGFFALAYGARIGRYWEKLSYIFLLASHNRMLRKLRRERMELIRQLEELKEAYLRLYEQGEEWSTEGI
ncbi:MAG: 1-acyl-sn-glycerol-3-phosphate acyltransferase [candidate division NC10 bacterium]|nr:1-acyl-sn-glycerol-3-phosphate acyltransferase [candidate division NC10 bacterium]